MSALLPILITVAWIAVAVVVSVVFSVRSRRTEQEWARSIAAALSMSFRSREEMLQATWQAKGQEERLNRFPQTVRSFLSLFSSWRVEGERGDFKVFLYPELRSHGRSTVTYIVLIAAFPRALPFEIVLGRRTAMSQFSRIFSKAGKLSTGDGAFDNKVVASGQPAEEVLAVLADPALKELLAALFEEYPDTKMDKQGFRWEMLVNKARKVNLPQLLEAYAAAYRLLADAAGKGKKS